MSKDTSSLSSSSSSSSVRERERVSDMHTVGSEYKEGHYGTSHLLPYVEGACEP
jgi:hypothetical protein